MNLTQWAIKWGVSVEATQDLQRQFGAIGTDPEPCNSKSEAGVSACIRLEASSKGARLLRNNVGACYTQNGGFLRYGLANESKAMNAQLKSSDLIGLRPLLITQAHVGQVVGQFIAREVKRADWSWSGSKPEIAQLNFLELVASLGGDAAFANGVGTV